MEGPPGAHVVEVFETRKPNSATPQPQDQTTQRTARRARQSDTCRPEADERNPCPTQRRPCSPVRTYSCHVLDAFPACAPQAQTFDGWCRGASNCHSAKAPSGTSFPPFRLSLKTKPSRDAPLNGGQRCTGGLGSSWHSDNSDRHASSSTAFHAREETSKVAAEASSGTASTTTATTSASERSLEASKAEQNVDWQNRINQGNPRQTNKFSQSASSSPRRSLKPPRTRAVTA